MNVLMIGATSFVAQAITKKMLQRGDCVYVLGRSQKKLMQVESDFSAAGLIFAGRYCYDFTDIQQTEDAFKLAKETLCSIDLVFICHGFLRAVMFIVICLPEILFQRLKFLSGR